MCLYRGLAVHSLDVFRVHFGCQLSAEINSTDVTIAFETLCVPKSRLVFVSFASPYLVAALAKKKADDINLHVALDL